MSFSKLGAEIFRDYETDGVPSSGAHDVIKADVRAWMLAVEAIAGNTPVSDVASATTADIGANGVNSRVRITGTTTITSLGTTPNLQRFVEFAASLTLTHNATTLILPGGQNIVTAAGDCAIFSSDASGNWRCTGYLRGDGYPLIAGQTTLASATTTNLGSVREQAVVISGTTTITAFGSAAATGAVKFVQFSGALTLTHNATTLILPGGQNIATAAGDCLVARHEGSGNWRVLVFTFADGHPLIARLATIASATTTDLGSTLAQAITISGTTTITGLGSSAPTGAVKFCQFSGALTLTHNGTSLIIPGAQNIATAAGDCMLVRHEGSGNWRLLAYDRATGAGLDIGQATLASATTTDLGSVRERSLVISGTTTITGFGSTALTGAVKFLQFSGALILTHNATSLIIPGALNITTVAGDQAVVRHEGSGNWRVVAYTRGDGQPLSTALSTIASASTTDLGSVLAQAITVSGTTTITAFGSSAPTGALKFVQFSGALILTHNGTSLILPGAANITTVAGDCLVARHEGSGNWRVTQYLRASGRPLHTATTDNVTVGFTATEYDNGTQSGSGTLTPNPANGNMQKAVNGGAFTLAPPTATGSYTIVLDITNNGSAGTITTSGFTKVSGDAFNTTNANAWRCFISKGQAGSHLHRQAMF